MTRIFVVRHAEAEGNLYRRIHGQYDSRITVNGRQQIEALTRRFETEAVDACYASDLLRTRLTAQAVYVPKRLPLRLDARFREVRLGAWEDLPFGELDAKQPDLMKKFNADPLDWRVDGSETFPEYSTRFLQAMQEAAAENDGKTIAIFSHGCVIRAMQQRLFFSDAAPHTVGHCDNTGVSLLEYENGSYRAVYLNDNHHVPPEISTLGRQAWWRTGGIDHNLWFRPTADADRYCDCRREAWSLLYEPMPARDAAAFYRQAQSETAGAPQALAEAVLGGAFAGLVQLDVTRFAAQNVGYVSFLYLLPQYRRQGLGVQMLGHAVSFFRARGRTKLWLSVSPRNETALRFYGRYGFRQVGTTPGSREPLVRLELPIGLEDACE